MAGDLRAALNHALCDELDAALGRIQHCVRQLSDEQIWSRARPDLNSIANLILHLDGNIRQMIVSNLSGAPDTRDRPSEFSARATMSGRQLLDRLIITVAQAREELRSASDLRFCEQRRVNAFDWTGLQAAVRSIAHFRGHAQEIIYMTRLILGDAYEYAGPR